MAQLIDSSVFITLERRGLPLDGLSSVIVPDEPVAITSIVASELLVGVHRADSPQRRLRRESFVETVLEFMPVLPFDMLAARIHAQVWAQLMADGRLIGSHDLITAAIALTHRYAVLTDNVREFRRVPGLEVRQPNW